MAQIHAYRKDTGEKVTIPEHWVDDPTLGEQFTTTPPAARSTAAQPDGDATTNSEVAKPATRKEK